MNNLGSYLREKRRQKELSLREVARRIGISHPYLSQIETGKEHKPSVDILIKLSQVLDVPLFNILDSGDYFEGVHVTEALRESAILSQKHGRKEKEQLYKLDLHTLLENKGSIKINDTSINFVLEYKDEPLTDKQIKKAQSILNSLFD